MKQGFDDGLFREDGRSLADVDDDDAGVEVRHQGLTNPY